MAVTGKGRVMDETLQGLGFSLVMLMIQGVLTVAVVSIPKMRNLWTQAPENGPVIGTLIRLAFCTLTASFSLLIGYFIYFR